VVVGYLVVFQPRLQLLACLASGVDDDSPALAFQQLRSLVGVRYLSTNTSLP
jgi:hypothetical protein